MYADIHIYACVYLCITKKLDLLYYYVLKTSTEICTSIINENAYINFASTKPPNPENYYFKLSDQDPVTRRREIELKTSQLNNSTQPNSKISNINFQIWKNFNIN